MKHSKKAIKIHTSLLGHHVTVSPVLDGNKQMQWMITSEKAYFLSETLKNMDIPFSQTAENSFTFDPEALAECSCFFKEWVQSTSEDMNQEIGSHKPQSVAKPHPRHVRPSNTYKIDLYDIPATVEAYGNYVSKKGMTYLITAENEGIEALKTKFDEIGLKYKTSSKNAGSKTHSSLVVTQKDVFAAQAQDAFPTNRAKSWSR